MKSDERTFPVIGNNLAIDFLNTQIVERGDIVELLKEPVDVYRWAQAVGMAVDKSVKDSKLKVVFEFRKALKSIFDAVLNDKRAPHKSIEILNQHLLSDEKDQKLNYIKGKFELQPILEKLTLDNLLGLIASEAASLLSSEQLKKLKRCSNEKCILLFLDTSKSGKRRWCSMDICGNRAKAASHYLNSRQ